MNIWFNGACTNAASVSGYNAGTLLGWGVYTTIGIWDGWSFALNLQLRRLRRDAGRAEVPLAAGDD